MTRTFAGFDRITSDPDILGGKPCIRGMRMTVKRALELAAQGLTPEELRQDYPELEAEDLRQAIAFAATLMDAERIVPFTHRAA